MNYKMLAAIITGIAMALLMVAMLLGAFDAKAQTTAELDALFAAQKATRDKKAELLAAEVAEAPLREAAVRANSAAVGQINAAITAQGADIAGINQRVQALETSLQAALAALKQLQQAGAVTAKGIVDEFAARLTPAATVTP